MFGQAEQLDFVDSLLDFKDSDAQSTASKPLPSSPSKKAPSAIIIPSSSTASSCIMPGSGTHMYGSVQPQSSSAWIEYQQQPVSYTNSPMLSSAAESYDDDDLDSLLLTPMISPMNTPSNAFQKLGLSESNLASMKSIDLPASTVFSSYATRPPIQRYSPYNNVRLTAGNDSVDDKQCDKPLTPAQMMRITKSSHKSPKNKALDAPVSSSSSTSSALKPIVAVLEGGKRVLSESEQKALAERSNYQNVALGELDNVIGVDYSAHLKGGIEVRKTNHKIAEQRRRNSIKKCFEDLRDMVPNIQERNPSRLYILEKTCEYVRMVLQQQQQQE